jgi:hypothetical protein
MTLEPAFHAYVDKPTVLISGSYTTVRGAELREIDAMLDQQRDDVPMSGFEDRFARFEDGTINTDHVEDCLDFLQAIDFVEVSAQGLVSRFNGHAFPDLSFEARLLFHLRRQSGRSRHITYISEVLARLDKRRVSVERLLEAVQNDDAESYSDELSWTRDKIRFWANLLDPLGALSYTTGADEVEVVASPTRALLAELITHYADHAEDGTRAVDCLRWIDEWFLPVFSERAGSQRVSSGVADTLYSMQEDDAVSLFRESDSQSVVELPRDGGTARSISTISVEKVPSSAAYKYPLARTTRRVSQ